jgi:hypothetical protein
LYESAASAKVSIEQLPHQTRFAFRQLSKTNLNFWISSAATDGGKIMLDLEISD